MFDGYVSGIMQSKIAHIDLHTQVTSHKSQNRDHARTAAQTYLRVSGLLPGFFGGQVVRSLLCVTLSLCLIVPSTAVWNSIEDIDVSCSSSDIFSQEATCTEEAGAAGESSTKPDCVSTCWFSLVMSPSDS